MESLQSVVVTSRLCKPDTWPLDIDEMAALNDTELNNLLDQSCHCAKSSTNKFDKECHDAKRLTLRLEHVDSTTSRRLDVCQRHDYLTVSPDDVAVPVTAAKRRGTTNAVVLILSRLDYGNESMQMILVVVNLTKLNQGDK